MNGSDNTPVIPTIGVVVFQEDKVLLVKHTEKSGHVANTYGLPAVVSSVTGVDTSRRLLRPGILQKRSCYKEKAPKKPVLGTT